MLTLQRKKGDSFVARPTKEVELKREELEGCLASLGSALCMIDLAQTRVGASVEILGHTRLLSPAIDDLSHAKDLIRGAQGQIKLSCPMVFDECGEDL